MALRVFVVAGDVSGDRHGGSLARELIRLVPNVELAGLGGPMLAQSGCRILHDMMPLAVMGLGGALAVLHQVKKIMRQALAFLKAWRPDLIVLIDYPGFNLHFAGLLKQQGMRTVYYIPPQLWAWASWRLRKLRRHFDKLLVIFPFEEPFYRRAGIDAEYVGHPAFDYLCKLKPDPGFRARLGVGSDQPMVGLLPGSRTQEIRKSLPVLCRSAALIGRELPRARFVLPLASTGEIGKVRAFLKDRGFPVTVVQDATFEVMASADLCLVVSGTATLELAYFLTPMVIVYRVNPVSLLLARLLVRTAHIGLVNIIANRRIAPELLLPTDNPRPLAREALRLLADENARNQQIESLRQLKEEIAYPGASRRAAEAILQLVGSDP